MTRALIDNHVDRSHNPAALTRQGRRAPCSGRFFEPDTGRDRLQTVSLQTSRQKPLTLFYSYAHEDERWRDTLAKYLAPLKQQGSIQEWHDRQIGAGEAWEDKIDAHLESADVVLLFISVDFIASEYCWGKEMLRALERHNTGEARVIPIMRHCGIKH